MQQNDTNYQAMFLGAFLMGYREGQEAVPNLKDAIANRAPSRPEFAEAIKMLERMTQEQIDQMLEAWPIAVAVSYVAESFVKTQNEVVAQVLATLVPLAQSGGGVGTQDS